MRRKSVEAARQRVSLRAAVPQEGPRHRAVPGSRWAIPLVAAAAAGVVLALLVAAVVARQLARIPGEPVPLEARPAEASASEPADPSGTPLVDLTEPVRTVVVHVVGQVQAPGLVTLSEGSRVADAISAAGGPTETADLSALNLARLVSDGEQIVVPAPGEALPIHGGLSPPGLLDLNTADVAALDGLPGIGPVLAGRIIDWRTDHGRFTSVEELAEVAGIGPTVLERIRDLVRV